MPAKNPKETKGKKDDDHDDDHIPLTYLQKAPVANLCHLASKGNLSRPKVPSHSTATMTIAQRLFYQMQSGLSSPLRPKREYHARPDITKPKILACSMMDKSQERLYTLTQVDRSLCEDRKTPFEHYQAGPMAKSVCFLLNLCENNSGLLLRFSFSHQYLCRHAPLLSSLSCSPNFFFLFNQTIRIVVTQSTFILSTYANDQLHKDLELNDLVAKGKMSREEADKEADEWEAVS